MIKKKKELKVCLKIYLKKIKTSKLLEISQKLILLYTLNLINVNIIDDF